MVACIYVISVILQAVTVNARTPAIFSVTTVKQGANATFECSYPNLPNSTSLYIYKNNEFVYQCRDISFTCGKARSSDDYSCVTFPTLGTVLDKGTFTVSHADQTRDGGNWTCKYGTSLISSSVTFVVIATTSTAATTTTTTTTSTTPAPPDDYSWCLFPHNGSSWPCGLCIGGGIAGCAGLGRYWWWLRPPTGKKKGLCSLKQNRVDEADAPDDLDMTGKTRITGPLP